MPAQGDLSNAVRAVLRDVPDFPRPGIVFKDITPVLANARLFERTVEAMAAPFAGEVTHIAAIESRGFLFGAPIALRLSAGLIPLRKPGKLPGPCHRVDYALEYGSDALETQHGSCDPTARVLVVDDVLATGGTAEAGCELIERTGATVVGCAFVLALEFLAGHLRLAGRRLSVVTSV